MFICFLLFYPFLSLLPELDKDFVQSLEEQIHLFLLHADGGRHSEVGSGVVIVVRAPVCEGVWTNSLTLSSSNYPICNNLFSELQLL